MSWALYSQDGALEDHCNNSTGLWSSTSWRNAGMAMEGQFHSSSKRLASIRERKAVISRFKVQNTACATWYGEKYQIVYLNTVRPALEFKYVLAHVKISIALCSENSSSLEYRTGGICYKLIVALALHHSRPRSIWHCFLPWNVTESKSGRTSETLPSDWIIASDRGKTKISVGNYVAHRVRMTRYTLRGRDKFGHYGVFVITRVPFVW